MPYDIAIVGGGPAGLSAAINARARGKSVLIVTNDYRESALYKAELVDNYLGLPSITGAVLMDAFDAHARSVGAEIRQGRVLNILPVGEEYYLSIGTEVESASAVILCIGVARGKKFAGEERLLGRGVSYCATCDGMLYRGKTVAVVGLAPDAYEEAQFLSSIGCHVTFVAAAPPAHLDTAIAYLPWGRVEMLGEEKVEGLKIGQAQLACDAVFLLRQAIAPSDLLPALDTELGYIRADKDGRTNLAGIFAAGDCTGLPLQASKAAGEGQIAGQKAAQYVDALHA